MTTSPKISRRGMFVTATIAAVAAQAQDATPKPASVEEDLASARNVIKTSSEALAKVKIPIALEPAFQFKA